MASTFASMQTTAIFKKAAPAPAKKAAPAPKKSLFGGKKAAPVAKPTPAKKAAPVTKKSAPVAKKSAATVVKKAAPAAPKKTVAKKTVVKKAPAKAKAAAGPAKKKSAGQAGAFGQGNVGAARTLWNGFESKPEAPSYLDGSLPGDAGFDPLGLSKPVEYLQFGLDGLDQNGRVNPSGDVIGRLKKVDNKPTAVTIVVSTPGGMRGFCRPSQTSQKNNIESRDKTRAPDCVLRRGLVDV
jgi:hypothetical protein